MTLTEMRDVIDAAIAGKKIQKWPLRQLQYVPKWYPHNDGDPFNFADWKYRIKPEPREGWAVIYPTKELAEKWTSLPTTVVKVREVNDDE